MLQPRPEGSTFHFGRAGYRMIAGTPLSACARRRGDWTCSSTPTAPGFAELADQRLVAVQSLLPGIWVLVPLASTRRQLEQSIPERGRILRRHQHRAGIVPDCLDQAADRGHDR